MNKEYNYIVIPELELIIQYFSGEITFEKLSDFKTMVIADKRFRAHYAQLLDFRKAQFNISPADIKNYGDYLAGLTPQDAKRRMAVLVSNTDQKKVIEMFKENDKLFAFTYEAFTETKDILDWLPLYKGDIARIDKEISMLANDELTE